MTPDQQVIADLHSRIVDFTAEIELEKMAKLKHEERAEQLAISIELWLEKIEALRKAIAKLEAE